MWLLYMAVSFLLVSMAANVVDTRRRIRNTTVVHIHLGRFEVKCGELKEEDK